jgi:hypothetical protein
MRSNKWWHSLNLVGSNVTLIEDIEERLDDPPPFGETGLGRGSAPIYL